MVKGAVSAESSGYGGHFSQEHLQLEQKDWNLSLEWLGTCLAAPK